jgi:hypothetical protein
MPRSLPLLTPLLSTDASLRRMHNHRRAYAERAPAHSYATGAKTRSNCAETPSPPARSIAAAQRRACLSTRREERVEVDKVHCKRCAHQPIDAELS